MKTVKRYGWSGIISDGIDRSGHFDAGAAGTLHKMIHVLEFKQWLFNQYDYLELAEYENSKFTDGYVKTRIILTMRKKVER